MSTVYYDGECGVCTQLATRWQARAEKSGAEIRFLRSQDPEAYSTLHDHDLASIAEKTLIFHADSRFYFRSVAVHKIMRACGGRYRLYGWLLWLVPWPIREVGYVVVSKNRWLLKPVA